jgi:hypothetical protein
MLNIFDFMRLLDTGTLLSTLVPDEILDFVHDRPGGATMVAIETHNKQYLKEKGEVANNTNIGTRGDWWTDKVFAQQQFAGPNPTTIEKASKLWLTEFSKCFLETSGEALCQRLGVDAESLYVQDCPYFRAWLGAGQLDDLVSEDGKRRLPTAVTLFHLGDTGVLHPLAIAIDYKGVPMDTPSFPVIWNPRRKATEREESVWYWRYAKTCAQISDWFRHEIEVHLVNTHLIEEATIVAAHRAFSVDHPVYRLLQPHWLKTLSVNASARSALVPNVITKIAGVTGTQLYTFIRNAYHHFDWTGKYVPNDLRARGFPPEELSSNPKFHNYVYGRNMILMWNAIRKFVAAVVAIDFQSDDQVAQDQQIRAWAEEMRSDQGGQLKSFPKINTVADLVDTVTMCIHIASPQHTAINYLQHYYQSFVPNKPPALFAPMATWDMFLAGITEADLVNAYPVKHAREWLLASHVPHLLSYRVAENENLPNFALSTAKLAMMNKKDQLAAAASQLYTDLTDLAKVFEKHSKATDDQTKPYDVMDPNFTAVSILL